MFQAAATPVSNFCGADGGWWTTWPVLPPEEFGELISFGNTYISGCEQGPANSCTALPFAGAACDDAGAE